jgi:hypothetical protein
LTNDSSRMIRNQALIPRHTMSRQESSTPKLGDASPATQSP